MVNCDVCSLEFCSLEFCSFRFLWCVIFHNFSLSLIGNLSHERRGEKSYTHPHPSICGDVNIHLALFEFSMFIATSLLKLPQIASNCCLSRGPSKRSSWLRKEDLFKGKYTDTTVQNQQGTNASIKAILHVAILLIK